MFCEVFKKLEYNTFFFDKKNYFLIKNMGYVYLIGEKNKKGKYKIGSTRAKDVNKRLKQLQTGNSSELFIKESYETEHPFKLEKMLHNRFKSSNLIGEWFDLSESDTEAFKSVCEEKEKIIMSLKNNPFYFKDKNIVPMFNSNKHDVIYSQEELIKEVQNMNEKLKNGEKIICELEHPLI